MLRKSSPKVLSPLLSGLVMFCLLLTQVQAATINNSPVLANNVTLNAPKGQVTTITNAELLTTDVENPASLITYTLTSLPLNGTLRRNGSNLALNNQFTQADINNGLITYAHNNSNTTTDSFNFNVVDRAGGTTNRATLTSTGGEANQSSITYDISGDGRYVVFYSDATNFVPGDTNGNTDVFFRDMLTNQTTRVSVASGGAQGTGGGSFTPRISADGRFIAYGSLATNLVAGDTNTIRDIFVYDQQLNQTTRVSVSSGGAQGDQTSQRPAISADGRFVAFTSRATTLVAGDTNAIGDIFVHDRQTAQTTRVSVATGGTQGSGGTGFVSLPAISADGRYVTFVSDMTNLVANDTNGKNDIFVHDRQTAQTSRVSVITGGAQSNGGTNGPSWSAISADGRYVTFDSDASDLVAGDTGGNDIFVHDRQTGQTRRISSGIGNTQPNGDSYSPSISDDGRFIAFQSDANNLLAGDTNGQRDAFVFDQQTNQMQLISVSSSGAQGNGSAAATAISHDGRYVSFDSFASNLVPGDSNNWTDGFVFDRATLNATFNINITSSQSTTTTLTSSPNPSTFGQSVTFTATLTPLAATGTVTFKNGAATLGTTNLTSGVATFSTAGLSVGNHNITAVYNGNPPYLTSTSNQIVQTVNKASSAVSLIAAPSPSGFGQSVTFTATLTPLTATGTVTFTFDGVTNVPVNLASGIATYVTSTLALGVHNVAANYGGDTNYNSSNNSISHTVNKITPGVTLTNTPNPSVYGQSVTFTATLTPLAATGTVTFTFDGIAHIPVNVVGGIATYVTSTLNAGSHAVIANYGGDANHAGNSSGFVNQVVSKAATTLSLTSNPNPAPFGQSVMFTATLNAITSGVVTFTFNGITATTATMSGGIASYVTTTLAVGTYTVTASFSGNTNYNPATSPSVTQVITADCNPLIVTNSNDNGQATVCGTLSYALVSASSGTTITFALPGGQNTITFTGSLTPTLAAGVTLNGGAGGGIILEGNGVSGDGLRLTGNNTLLNLLVRRFAGREIVANNAGTGSNKLYQVRVES